MSTFDMVLAGEKVCFSHVELCFFCSQSNTGLTKTIDDVVSFALDPMQLL
jgi:hypothetical protein